MLFLHMFCVFLVRCFRYEAQTDDWSLVPDTELAHWPRVGASSVVMPNGDWVVQGGHYQVLVILPFQQKEESATQPNKIIEAVTIELHP